MFKNENNIVVLESDEKKRLYKLELMARSSLSSILGSYVITIFDCCREYMAPPILNTRGLDDDNDDEPVPEKYQHSKTNLIIINGCPPNKFVPATSFISRGFF